MANPSLVTQAVNEIIAEHGITELDMEFSGDWWEPSDEIRRYRPQRGSTVATATDVDPRAGVPA
jgi:hypothetical protein